MTERPLESMVAVIRCNECGEEWTDEGYLECPACGSDDYDVAEWVEQEVRDE